MRGLESSAGFPELHRFAQRAFVIRLSQRTGCVHAAKDPLLALSSPFHMQDRIEARRSLGKTGEESGFGGAQVRRIFPEIKTGGSGGASVETAVIDALEVLLKDAFFRPDLLEAHGLQSFDALCSKCARPRLCQFYELLRQS